jgi:hypothetical protein
MWRRCSSRSSGSTSSAAPWPAARASSSTRSRRRCIASWSAAWRRAAGCASASCGSTPIAFHLGFEYGARFIWYKPAFSALHAKRSPGEVLLKFLLEDAVARGLAEFDFTVGNDTFKYRFANRVRTNHRIRVYSLPTGYWLRRARKLAKRILRPARSRAASAASGDAPLGAACASGRPAISRAD